MSASKTAAIVGSGNIGTDLLMKLLRSKEIEPVAVIGIDQDSPGLARAARAGVDATAEGVDWLFGRQRLPDLVFEATSAKVHAACAPRYAEAGIRAIDLTPAAVGPYLVPPVNGQAHAEAMNVNLITCGGQATIPMVYAVSRVAGVSYAEIVASVASVSAGPGTRANIDEFTRTTTRGIEVIGGAREGKAIIVLNPADPPMIMRDTIFCAVDEGADEAALVASIRHMAAEIADYVPGYRLLAEPVFDEVPGRPESKRVAIFVEVAGAGDFLPPYAGNLDIMTAAAVRAGEQLGGEPANAVPAPSVGERES